MERAAAVDGSIWRQLVSEYNRFGDEKKSKIANARALSFERGAVEIKDIMPNWHDGWSNGPTLKVVVSREPHPDEFIYTQKGPLYFANVGPICSFFAYERLGRGYGGRRFDILMNNGETKSLIGPWSSGSYAMNKNGFGPCLSVSLTADLTVMNRGFTFIASSILVSTALPLLAKKGLGLVLMESGMYEITSRKKYPKHGPYFTKDPGGGKRGGDTKWVTPFSIVTEEVLAPND